MAIILTNIADDDRLFLTMLAKDIRARPDAYREAGQWLDMHYSKDRCWEREKQQPNAATGKNQSRYRRNVDRKIARFGLVVRDMNYEQLALTAVTQLWAARRLLVLWLLTDPDASRLPSKLTEFQHWRWEANNESFPRQMTSRGVHNWGEWMRLGRLAWAILSPADVAPSSELDPANENESHIASAPHMPPRARLAFDLYEKGYEALNKPEATDDKVYDFLNAVNEKEKEKEKVKGKEQSGEPNPMQLPARSTWKRNLRIARKALGKQQYTPRAGRADAAGSIRRASQI